MKIKIYKDSLYNGEHSRILVDTIEGDCIELQDLFSALEYENEVLNNAYTVEIDTDICHKAWWGQNSIQVQKWLKHVNAIAVKHESRGKLLMKMVFEDTDIVPEEAIYYGGKYEIER